MNDLNLTGLDAWKTRLPSDERDYEASQSDCWDYAERGRCSDCGDMLQVCGACRMCEGCHERMEDAEAEADQDCLDDGMGDY